METKQVVKTVPSYDENGDICWKKVVTEKRIEEGENPVGEKRSGPNGIHSISGHEKSGEKTGGPSSKPKYYLMTDSGTVL